MMKKPSNTHLEVGTSECDVRFVGNNSMVFGEWEDMSPLYSEILLKKISEN